MEASHDWIWISTSDWMKKWRLFSKPFAYGVANIAKPKKVRITFDTGVNTALKHYQLNKSLYFFKAIYGTISQDIKKAKKVLTQCLTHFAHSEVERATSKRSRLSVHVSISNITTKDGRSTWHYEQNRYEKTSSTKKVVRVYYSNANKSYSFNKTEDYSLVCRHAPIGLSKL